MLVTLRALRDGVLVLEGVPLENLGAPIVEDRLDWGDLSVFARGASHWASISHDGLVPVVCP